jgi:hypothetical protein
MDSLTLSKLPAAIGAVGALGTAAFGIVDTLKGLPLGGVSHAGFKFIDEVIVRLAPEVPALKDTALERKHILEALHSQWINGTDSSAQVSIAKSLIKLRLRPDTAKELAAATAVDAVILGQIAEAIAKGQPLSSPVQTDIYGRFDLMLSTLLDQAYQHADQCYRNWAKCMAMFVAVAIAYVAAVYVAPGQIAWPKAVLLGLLATPIAPMAKDLSTALTTGVQAIQAWGK